MPAQQIPPLILSLGSINADLQFDVHESLSSGGTLRAGGFAQRAGGKAANVAFFTHRLGVPTKLLGRVGNDQFAKLALEPLEKAGLNLDHVSRAPDSPTGIAVVAVPEGGNKTILSAPNANECWDDVATNDIAAAIRNAPDHSVLVADFEISLPALEAAFDAAGERGFKILIDPTFADRIDVSTLQRFCAVTPNQKEAADLLAIEIKDDADARRAALQLNAIGAEIACVKLAHGGCVLAHRHEAQQLPAPSVDVVDKTGAGDAFIAAMAVALLEDRPVREAACWGVAASTIAVQKKGAQESYPSRGELERMIGSVMRASSPG